MVVDDAPDDGKTQPGPLRSSRVERIEDFRP
jgi:hypothetical protein